MKAGSTIGTHEYRELATGEDTRQCILQDDELLPPSPVEVGKTVRKVDAILLPLLGICYAFFYIDKTTLSYAAIFGIKEDLNLEGSQYSWLSSVFYFGFLAWALPTNLLLQKTPVGKYISVNIVFWGVFLMLQAASEDFKTIATLRGISGAAEACFDPGAMLIFSMWYTREEQPLRMGIWLTFNGFGIAVGGLLGYAIGNIKGSLASWKYEFLVIGAACSFWGLVMLFLLPDSPVTSTFFSKPERRLIIERVRGNQTGIENKHFKWYQVQEALTDYKLYLFFSLGVFANIPNGGISNFGTIIIQGFGFSTLGTTLMQIPYGAMIAISIIACVTVNHYLKNKRCVLGICFVVPNIVGSLGLLMLPTDSMVGRLICYYLTGPYNATFVLIMSLVTANIAGHTKKVVTSAFLFLGYCVGNAVGPFFYKEDQAPGYKLGIASMLFSHIWEILLLALIGLLMARENKRRDCLQLEYIDAEMDSEEEDPAFSDLTDWENRNFRYIY